MNGDFSKWNLYDPQSNDAGVLQQQGRVLLDQDWNAQTQIVQHWQDHFAKETLGCGVAAVPASSPDAFEVTHAAVVNVSGTPGVEVSLGAGTLWADGIHLHLGSDAKRSTTYLAPPIQDPQAEAADLGDGSRDAVILEVYREAINAFQEPQNYFEPALGGVDTTERLRTAYRLRLLRLTDEKGCACLKGKLKTPEDKIGRLTVSLEPTTAIAGDCPVVGGGGYTGFEHHLYRIDIAKTNSADPHFKWSPFNGGLVGRGRFDDSGATKKVILTANRNAIVNAGALDFYLEALSLNPATGNWEVTYGANVSRNSNDDLEVQGSPLYGTFPSGTGTVFFRLWHDIEKISDFTDSANPKELQDGIQLVFDDPATKHYEPGDNWTFPVRAGEINNPETLIDDALPHGKVTHRVPLAIIEWGAQLDTSLDGKLIDCRRRFRPLTARACCTIQVGDGFSSFGDFNSIEEAISHLPENGGHICLLPGNHRTNSIIHDRKNITIHGCGVHSRVLPREETKTQPIFAIDDSVNITVSHMDLVQLDGTAIHVEASEWQKTREFRASRLRILAAVSAITLNRVFDAEIADCRLAVVDSDKGKAVLDTYSENCLIKDNLIYVVPAGRPSAPTGDDTPEDDDPSDPCADSDHFYGNIAILWAYAEYIWNFVAFIIDFVNPQPPYKAIGGIHLRGGCRAVRVYDNVVRGGRGFGITFGGILLSNDELNASDDPLPKPETQDESHTFETNVAAFMQATVVDEDGKGLKDIPITFSSEEGSQTALSGEGGNLAVKLESGSYEIGTSADLKITEVKQLSSFPVGSGRIIVLSIATAPNQDIPPNRVEERAPLHNIRIERNALLAMGLSGIGFTWHSLPSTTLGEDDAKGNPVSYLQNFLDPAQLSRTTNSIHDLRIGENYIEGCFLTPLTTFLRRALQELGLGGISLPVCDLVDIAGNRITRNGFVANKPVCGIYVGFCNDLEISHNTIEHHGQISEEGEASLETGIRGGIYVRYAGTRPEKLLKADSTRRPAIRINHNRVDQPVGRALTVLAFGPVECTDNYFHSGLRGKRIEDQLVGTVLILNLAGIQLIQYYKLLGKMGGSAEALIGGQLLMRGLNASDSASAPATDASALNNRLQGFMEIFEALPLGQTKVQGNIVEKGAANKASISQMILSLHDVAFQNNQSACIDIEPSLANTVLVSQTLRAQGNRFTELSPVVFYSLFSASISFNQSVHNQADHCVISTSFDDLPGYDLNEDNQVRIPAVCEYLNSSADRATPSQRFFYLLILSYITSNTNLAKTTEAEAKKPEVQEAILHKMADAGTVGIKHNYGTHYANRKEMLDYQRHRYGTEKHPEVEKTKRELEAEAGINAKLSENLDYGVLFEDVKGAVDEKAFEGRVALVQGHGTSGLMVEVLDASGNSTGLKAKTDRNGHYRIPVENSRWEELAEADGLKLRVRDESTEKAFEVDNDSLTFGKNDRAAINEIKVRKFGAGDTDTQPSQPVVVINPVIRQPVRPIDTDTVDARIRDLSLVGGIGETRAKRLIEAGVGSLEDLVRFPNDKLREILPGVNPQEIKSEAKNIIRSNPNRRPPG